jgi:hypothetical protein
VSGGSWFCEEAKFDAAGISVAAARGEQNTRKTVDLTPCYFFEREPFGCKEKDIASQKHQ